MTRRETCVEHRVCAFCGLIALRRPCEMDARYVRCWQHIASFRCYATIRPLSGHRGLWQAVRPADLWGHGRDIVLGIVGAIVGGYLFTLFGAQGVSGANIYSMFVAVIGAIVVLVIYHSVTGRRTV